MSLLIRGTFKFIYFLNDYYRFFRHKNSFMKFYYNETASLIDSNFFQGVRRNGSAGDRRRPVVRTASEDEGSGSKKERKASAASRFTIYKVNKASRKKREKSSAKKERKATKTLAIVLGKLVIRLHVFYLLLVCVKILVDIQCP